MMTYTTKTQEDFENSLEPRIRSLVLELRKRGFNTIQSCQHVCSDSGPYILFHTNSAKDADSLDELLDSLGWCLYDIEYKIRRDVHGGITRKLLLLFIIPKHMVPEKGLKLGVDMEMFRRKNYNKSYDYDRKGVVEIVHDNRVKENGNV